MASSSGNSAPLPPLPSPVPPTAPDFSLCLPFYGTGLVRSDCEVAASHLPTGSTPIPLAYYQHPFNFPLVAKSHQEGGCRVTVTWFNPDSTSHGPSISIAPDTFRQMASWLISSCVTQNGLGGFETYGLQNQINWLADPTTSNGNIRNGPVPARATFFTVTIDKNDYANAFDASSDDPAVAEALSDGVRDKGNVDRADVLTDVSRFMERAHGYGRPTAWWSFFMGAGEDEDTPPSDMVYTCDAKLGAPKAVDCSQLAYSGLGPPSDTVTVGPGASKPLSLGTCRVVVTAAKTIALTWAQISAGLNTLVDSCVIHPLLGARGGVASYGKSTVSKGRKRATAPVSGLDALPPGVNITLCDTSNCPKGL